MKEKRHFVNYCIYLTIPGLFIKYRIRNYYG